MRKYNGQEDPQIWLEDYLAAIIFGNGNRTTAMQSIQLFLRDSARNWLKGLMPESITSWDGLERKFVSNFQDTCKRPVSFQELKACRQKQGESIRSYIQR